MFMYGMPEGTESQLENACAEGNIQSVRQLCAEGADVEFENPLSGHTPLMIAAWYGQFQIVEELLLRQGASPSHRDRSGITALHYAAEDGYTDIARLLIRNGVKVNIQSRQNGQTALHIVCGKGFMDFAIALVENGANLKIKDAKAQTAEDIAIERGYEDIVSLLTAKDEDEIASIVSAHTVPVDFTRPYFGGRHSIRPQMTDLNSVAANASIQHEQLREQIKNLRRERADFFAQFQIYKSKQKDVEEGLRDDIRTLEQRIDTLQEVHMRTVKNLNDELADCRDGIMKMIDKFNIVTQTMQSMKSSPDYVDVDTTTPRHYQNQRDGIRDKELTRKPSGRAVTTTAARRERELSEHGRRENGHNPIARRTAIPRGNSQRNELGGRPNRRQVSNDTSMSGSSRSTNKNDDNRSKSSSGYGRRAADDIPRVADIKLPPLDSVGSSHRPQRQTQTPVKSPGLFTARTPTSAPRSAPTTTSSGMPSLRIDSSNSSGVRSGSRSQSSQNRNNVPYIDDNVMSTERLRLGQLGEIPSGEEPMTTGRSMTNPSSSARSQQPFSLSTSKTDFTHARDRSREQPRKGQGYGTSSPNAISSRYEMVTSPTKNYRQGIGSPESRSREWSPENGGGGGVSRDRDGSRHRGTSSKGRLDLNTFQDPEDQMRSRPETHGYQTRSFV